MTDQDDCSEKATSFKTGGWPIGVTLYDGAPDGEVLARYSTPGLRKNVLSYANKRDQLAGMGVKGDDADAILRELY